MPMSCGTKANNTKSALRELVAWQTTVRCGLKHESACNGRFCVSDVYYLIIPLDKAVSQLVGNPSARQCAMTRYHSA